ncbi:MAG: amino acid:proton antiporter, partial [Raoultibacter sp.]
AFVVLGELVRVFSARGRTSEYKGLTPALAAQRLAEEAQEAEESEGEGEASPEGEAVPENAPAVS